VVHLLEVVVALQLELADLPLLDRGLRQEGAAEELVFLSDALEEDVSDPARTFVSGVREEGDLNVHDKHLWRQTDETVSRALENHVLGLLHADVALVHEGFVFLAVLDVERGVL